MAVGRPTIESPEHQHGKGEHDHGIHEDKDFTYTATVEVLPEIEVKGYTGVALTQDEKKSSTTTSTKSFKACSTLKPN